MRSSAETLERAYIKFSAQEKAKKEKTIPTYSLSADELLFFGRRKEFECLFERKLLWVCVIRYIDIFQTFL